METNASALYCIWIFKNPSILYHSHYCYRHPSHPCSYERSKCLTFSYSASSPEHQKTTLQNPQELQYHRKPQESLPKETHGKKGHIVQEIRVQQISDRPFPMTKMN